MTASRDEFEDLLARVEVKLLADGREISRKTLELTWRIKQRMAPEGAIVLSKIPFWRKRWWLDASPDCVCGWWK